MAKKMRGHRIFRVLPGGIAEEMGVEPGMYLVSVNGHEIEDVFDYRFYMTEEHLEILIREESGEETLLEIDRDPDEEFGIEFESSLMSEYRSCKNRCIFCFIDQLPKGLRPTLYFKDDDSRLSFLQGNYVTLTNMSDRDIDRIIQFRMEPINVSVHTTNPALRRKMLGNRFAGDIFPKLRRLADAGIELNGQIVLCRGVNDGEELERTIRELASYRPAMRSVSVVPVGLTKYREHLPRLEPFDRESAGEVIDRIESWQRKLAADGICPETPHFIHASDEWYILAGREMPEEERYDGYLQYENGVGMVRLMETEVRAELSELTENAPPGFSVPCRSMTLVCGTLAAGHIRRFMQLVEEAFPSVRVRVQPIRNDFFGPSITVTGLVTGQDLIAQLKEIREQDPGALGEELLLPVTMLRSGEKVFLDDLTTDDVERELSLPVHVVWATGTELVRAALGLAPLHDGRRQLYESWEPEEKAETLT